MSLCYASLGSLPLFISPLLVDTEAFALADILLKASDLVIAGPCRDCLGADEL